VPPEVPPPLLTGIRRALANPVAGFSELAFTSEIIVNARRIHGGFVMVNRPDEVERIMVRDIANYRKGNQQQRRLRPGLRDGLLTAEGETWKAGRRVTAPLFSPRAVANAFFDDMVAVTEDMAARWDGAPPGAPFDILAETARLTYEIVSRTVFSGALDEDRLRVHESMALYFETIGRVDLLSFLNLPEWLPTRARRLGRPALEVFRGTVGAAVARRREERAGGPAAKSDLLDRLIDAVDPETGRKMPDDEVFDNVLTFLAAGHETTANTLAWTAYLVALFPWADEEMAAEIGSVTGGGRPDREAIDRLPFTRAVVDEALRLYPPAAFLGREALADDEIAGRPVRAGTQLLISPWVIHRHRSLWQDPDLFAPDRFLGERRQAIPRGAYLPFGLGPRICIGQAFALQEIVAALAVILPRFRFRLVDGPPVEPLARITLRPRYGLPLALERRS
jgi:cytochrome P450